jgi:hypothetical protein
MRKPLALAALLLVCISAPAFSCDLTAGPGAVVRLGEGKSGGAASIGCIFGERWELRGWWIGEQVIYDGTITIEAFPAISGSRIWMFREGHKFRPMLGVGIMLKESHRCHFDGDLDCNRQVPLSFCFLPTAGFRWGDVLVTAFHCSNASLDWGPEKKNLGLDGIRAEVWLR